MRYTTERHLDSSPAEQIEELSEAIGRNVNTLFIPDSEERGIQRPLPVDEVKDIVNGLIQLLERRAILFLQMNEQVKARDDQLKIASLKDALDLLKENNAVPEVVLNKIESVFI